VRKRPPQSKTQGQNQKGINDIPPARAGPHSHRGALVGLGGRSTWSWSSVAPGVKTKEKNEQGR